MAALEEIALLYDDDAYVEAMEVAAAPRAGAIGLMGRQVAGKEFLNALLLHGAWSSLVGVVSSDTSAESLKRFCFGHPSAQWRQRRLTVVWERRLLDDFSPRPAPVLHLPGPLDSRHAWIRQGTAAGAYALSGVTHTLCSDQIARQICELVTAPYEPFDSLVCTSRAVVAMVRAVAGAYTDFLRDRFGGSPRLIPRLELIPLGVDTKRFQPATPEERAGFRAELGIAENELAVLFVGRLSHHAKAHPFPMFAGLGHAARAVDRPVRLILCGWASNEAVRRAFLEGAAAFCPEVRLTLLDGHDPRWRSGAWKAADVFTSLSDNIQETFGLVVIEAMASGLPVVASDWDGYRDLVVDGETGLLVPTLMLSGATTGVTSRLLLGEINYDVFLAECSQASAVDPAAAAAAYARLLGDAALRRQMGEAGRRRALEHFAWPVIIAAYERLWYEQDEVRRNWIAREGGRQTDDLGPALYPAPERSFAGYPTAWLSSGDPLQAVAVPEHRVERLTTMPLTNHVAERRAGDAATIHDVLSAAAQPRPISALVDVLHRAGHSSRAAHATLAWMLKYGLLRHSPSESAAPGS
jgi:glycosyltransferase involved in cell wall biosynthesis